VEDSLVFIQPFVIVCKWAEFGYFIHFLVVCVVSLSYISSEDKHLSCSAGRNNKDFWWKGVMQFGSSKLS